MADILDIRDFITAIGDGISIAPDDVISGAIDDDLSQIVIVGIDGDGDLFFASSQGAPETALLLGRAHHDLMARVNDD